MGCPWNSRRESSAVENFAGISSCKGGGMGIDHHKFLQDMHRINGPSLFIGHGVWREPKKKYICTFIISELLATYPVLLPGEQFPISGVSFVALFWQGFACQDCYLVLSRLEASSPRCGFPIIWLHSLVYLTLIERQT